jgi:hypothetical protein
LAKGGISSGHLSAHQGRICGDLLRKIKTQKRSAPCSAIPIFLSTFVQEIQNIVTGRNYARHPAHKLKWMRNFSLFYLYTLTAVCVRQFFVALPYYRQLHSSYKLGIPC